MKIIILCGVFAKENEDEIIKSAKRPVEFSANIFQKKLILGFKDSGFNTKAISAPFIGSYPNASDIRVFSMFERPCVEYEYVSFNNIWGIRNFSRSAALKKKMEGFIKDDTEEKLIVIYSPHTPFLEAAVYAKRKNPNIKICLIVPDLPQYMNLNAKKSLLYKWGKQFDIKRINKLNKSVDSFVLLTEAMTEKIDVSGKKYCVVEGIVDERTLKNINEKELSIQKSINDERYIVYTGKMNEKFGVIKLVDEFCHMDNPSYRLVLCGSGDADGYIKDKIKTDSRINATGQITPDEATAWIKKADVLVNPRENIEEYTKYSFPSKTIEYLLSGKPVVGFLLDGMPKIYKNFIIDAGERGFSFAIEQAMNLNDSEKWLRYKTIKDYMKTLSAKTLAERIINMNYSD